MEKQTALHILRSLAQGIDPCSGEVFPTHRPCRHPDTVRALFEAARALTELPANCPRAASPVVPTDAGKPGTVDEDHLLAERRDAGRTLPELANEPDRSRVAVQARLVTLGKMASPAELPRFSRLAARATLAASASAAPGTAVPVP